MFQELWELCVDWDAPLPEELQAAWMQWQTALHHLTAGTVPRCVNADYDEIGVHIFTDASPKAYRPVTYLLVCRLGISNANFTYSKSRVAPLKKLSLPRLELTGMLMGARLKGYLARSFRLQVEGWYLWMNSTIALHHVRGSAKQWKPFVANHVMEIQQITNPDQWNQFSSLTKLIRVVAWMQRFVHNSRYPLEKEGISDRGANEQSSNMSDQRGAM